ncbi:amidohydrolase family protein [Halosegnis rubeus]|jgi:5-methylthioadenosine/S-adenosylhomocysteine deaminase|uniref:5-methylthioadenosine/S-adenosylhomocysteine deaminase n=1 Tax=Halosegnis rubeus TaxID=2212850 RepID=A0A5N5UGX1_9EURY|nr:amidohydrolase [Halosegnis rubeus]KAB7515157.1 amidohydrolase family protein [Halosegnis rubeus]KAB7516211.1 amidohydrolase family protein [Halosegnis rubeus]KAB7517517.1 amidohydrolase family protein [Halosegnis rubeus]
MTLLVTGGRILRPDHTVERADVRIDTDGDIDAIGDLERTERDQPLDAEGGLVTPGFVNAHGHAAMTLLRGYADDKPLDAWLQEDIWPTEAELGPEDIAAGARLAAVEMIRSGTTAFADMYFHVPELVDVIDEAGLRARVGHGVVTVGKDEAAAEADVQEALDIAAEYDGAADGRVRTAVMPHATHTVDTDSLERLVAGAQERGVPLHFHFNETESYLDPDGTGERPGAYADRLDLLGDSAWAAHGVHLTDEEIDRLADTGTAVVHCPASNMKLASGLAPVERLREAGVTVALGTDGAASNNDLDMFGEMRDAAMVGKLAADDASAVPASAVVEMATQAGADALGLPGGKIAEGEPADLAVVDLSGAHLTPEHDLVSHLAYAARGSDVRHTVCDGKVLLRDGELLTLDPATAKREAEERAREAVERAS